MTEPSAEEQYYIRASEERTDDRTRVLKQGDTFAVFDRHGDVKDRSNRELGVYCDGTRMLSRMVLLLNGQLPLLLSSTVKNDNVLLAVDLTNPDIVTDHRVDVPHGTLHVFRSIFLWDNCCYERIRISNHGLTPVLATLTMLFDADFADIFEVRGAVRPQRGERRYQIGAQDACITYHGLDQVERTMRVATHPAPTRFGPHELHFMMPLPPQQTETLYFTWTFSVNGPRVPPVSYDDALLAAETALDRQRRADCSVTTSNEQFDGWLSRSASDIHMMITCTPEGLYPYAGVPWFSTPFGRDGIITALQYLWINPEVARGVLQFLASLQADTSVPEQDAEPGKILHEARHGEMATLNEVPFGRYYGGADTTPLFVMLAGAYYQRTADLGTAQALWPHVERALQWMWRDGDRDGDGFLEYERQTLAGLANQGWKDSFDSVFHADGRLADPPIALCEIQGYAYAALNAAAILARTLEMTARADELLAHAARLRQQIEDAFWCEELGTYALALDGSKRQCRVRASNAGHLLFCGVPSPERAARTAATLLGDESYSGWGVRTIAHTESRYNPMSYHNGSIWPHDNALIGMGLARYGIKDGAAQLLSGLFDASVFVDLHRMPELFCGFLRRPGEGPTAYPVACAPQSWAAAAVFLLLQSCIGLSIDGPAGEVQIRHPYLPAWLDQVRIRDLRVGEASLDLELLREGRGISVTVTRRVGEVNVVVVK